MHHQGKETISRLSWHRASEGLGQTPRRSLKKARDTFVKPLQRAASAAAVLVHSPEVDKQIKDRGTSARGQLKSLLSKEEASPSIGAVSERRGQEEASKEVPCESRAASLTTPDIGCSDPSKLSEGVSLYSTMQVDLNFCFLHPV